MTSIKRRKISEELSDDESYKMAKLENSEVKFKYVQNNSESKLIKMNYLNHYYTQKNHTLNINWIIIFNNSALNNSNLEVFNDLVNSDNEKINLLIEIDNNKFTFNVTIDQDEKGANEPFLNEFLKHSNIEMTGAMNVNNCKTINFEFKNDANENKVATNKKELILNNDQLEKCKNDNFFILITLRIVKTYQMVVDNQNTKNFNYTGIINEGMTCYMNSMLQTFNIINPFKKALFSINSTNENTYSFILSLQRVFYSLMKLEEAISIKKLITSFGWSREQTLIQHDVQEFNHLLLELIEKKVKGTNMEGIFTEMFQGKVKNYIKCVDVDYKSERVERFNDLQLTIKGCNNIYDSLDLYTSEELLDKENKYDAEGFGKQTAKKGIKFEEFPDVLIVQLKRFEYNPKKEIMVKINDKFEFFDSLDMNKYMDKESEDNKFTLHSVMVHQGQANSGHYYCYLKPSLSNHWLLFDDEEVRPANEFEAITLNYGGSYKIGKIKGRDEIYEQNHVYDTSAYVLVYLRNTKRKQILETMYDSDVIII